MQVLQLPYGCLTDCEPSESGSPSGEFREEENQVQGGTLLQGMVDSNSSAVDIRSIFVDSRGKRWRWVVDDRMRDYGDIDYERRVIRINRALHARNRESLIDTLFHEELHRLLPYLGERAICALTTLLLPTLSTRYRRWLYAHPSALRRALH